MYSMPVRTVWTFRTSSVITCPVYMLPSVESSQPGTKIGRFFSAAASTHEFFGSIWYEPSSLPPRRILYMNSWGKKRSPARSAAIHSSSTTFSMRRIASCSGMQVSVTRFMWRARRSPSSSAVSARQSGIRS